MEDAGRSNTPSASAPAARPSPWQEAHMDILGMVLHRASSLPDSARAAVVCRAWHHAVVHLHPWLLPPQLPWLLLPDLKLCCGLSSSDGSMAGAHLLPQPVDGALPVCVGSTGDGRVILCKRKQSFVFLNPLSGATSSPFPDLHLADKWETNFTVFSCVVTYPNRTFYKSSSSLSSLPHRPSKVVMSGGSSCMIAGIQGHATLFVCRSGATTWSVIHVIRLRTQSQSDIAFHNGKLYMFNTNGYYSDILAFDIEEHASGVLRVTLALPYPGPPTPVRVVDKALYYLTESRGRLVVVRRDLSNLERRTRAVTVFALDESTGRPEWERMENLGGEIMFLSANSSVSVPSSRYRDARGDRVYFSQEEIHVWVDGCPRQKGVCPHHHCEVFDMRTRTAETLCTGMTPDQYKWCYGPTWFLPSHQPEHANDN